MDTSDICYNDQLSNTYTACSFRQGVVRGAEGLCSLHTQPQGHIKAINISACSWACSTCSCFRTRHTASWQGRVCLTRGSSQLALQSCLKEEPRLWPNWHLYTIMAIMLQVDVERPDNLETTALGAAYAAGIGSGLWTPEWVMQHRATARQGDKLRSTFRPQASAELASPNPGSHVVH